MDRNRRIHLFSQTTMDPEMFKEVESGLRDYLAGDVKTAFRSSCTICGQMKKRKPGLRIFARKHDVMVFVSGKNSSNCRSLNPRSHWISQGNELDPEWFRDAGSIGISGATSTSREQLESVRNQVEKLIFS